MIGDLKQLLKTAWKQASDRQAPLLAAGIAFYLFLALFPAMIASILCYGLVVDEETLQRHSRDVADALPEDAASLVTGQMESLTQTSGGSLGLGLFVALTLALYSASGGTGNLITGINAMFGYTETRNFLQRKLLALGLTAGAIVMFAVVISLVAVTPAVVDEVLDGRSGRWIVELVRWPLLLLALLSGIGVLYRLAPNRGEAPPTRLISRGVIVSAAAWAIASVGFSVYVDNFGSYGKTYGALAGVVVLLLWLWAGLYALLLGASVEAVREERIEEEDEAEDTPSRTDV